MFCSQRVMGPRWGGGKTDREMEVASVDKTETVGLEEGPKCSPGAAEDPWLARGLSAELGPWSRGGAPLPRVPHPPRWQSSQMRLGSNLHRMEGKVLFRLILNMPVPQNGGSESETTLLRKIKFYSLPT